MPNLFQVSRCNPWSPFCTFQSCFHTDVLRDRMIYVRGDWEQILADISEWGYVAQKFSAIEILKFDECWSRRTIDSYLIDRAVKRRHGNPRLGIDYAKAGSWRTKRNLDLQKPEAGRTSHISCRRSVIATSLCLCMSRI